MTDSVSDSIEIAADHDAVMDVIADFPAYPQWQEEVNQVEVLAVDEDGWGRRVRFHVDAGVLTAGYVLDYEYTGTAMSWRLVESDELSRLDGSYTLEAAQIGTRVTYTLEVALNMPLPGMLRRRAARRIVRMALHGLKARVEGNA